MRERPILFSAPMVRALLDGSKTQTRRIVNPRKTTPIDYILNPSLLVDRWRVWWQNPEFSRVGESQNCPYGEPGDQLWVKETHAHVGTCDPGYLVFAATYPRCLPSDVTNIPANIKDAGYKWKPSIFMRREYSRIQLELTNIRVERLQDISKEDAIAEGILPNWCGDLAGFDGDEHGWLPFALKPGQENIPGVDIYEQLTPQRAYQVLWESINGPGSWAANPWVWCVEFRRVKP